MITMQLDSRIGILCSGKHYCFAHGYDHPETIGTREECEVALGLRPAAPHPTPSTTNQPAAKPLRKFVVTVTPQSIIHAGTWRGGEYTVEVYARTHSEAITKARQERIAEEGRHSVAASYRAKLAS